jgi:anaerobic magnesium-protoporphyrin IX monomethyl ester cyclase
MKTKTLTENVNSLSIRQQNNGLRCSDKAPEQCENEVNSVPRLMFGFFGDWISYPASILSSLAIKKGWKVNLCYFAENLSETEIIGYLEQDNPDLLALTLMTCDRGAAFKVAKLAKEREIKVVVGGIHAGICPDDLIQTGFFDGVVRGDGMGVFEDILDGYKELKGEIIVGKGHPDISTYYDCYYSESQKNQIIKTKTLDTLSMLDCPLSCSFCATNTKPFIKLPIEAVAQNIVDAHRNYGVEDIFFRDDLFTLSSERVRTFRQIVQKNGLDCEYHLHARGDRLNDEMLSELKALGVEDMNIGIESLSDKILNLLNKGVTAEQHYQMAERVARYGMGLGIHLLFGLPTQDREDYEKTLDFVRQVKPYRVLCHYFVPLPGTALFQYCIDNGYLSADHSLDDYCLFIQANKPDFKGFREQTGFLSNVDYEMAVDYMKKTLDIHYEQVGNVILDAAEKADQESWIVVGAGDYFYRVLERLGQRKWKNLLGFYNYMDTESKGEGYLSHIFPHSIPEYRWLEDQAQPKNILVTKHNGRVFRRVIEPLIRDEKGFSGQIFSAATLG